MEFTDWQPIDRTAYLMYRHVDRAASTIHHQVTVAWKQITEWYTTIKTRAILKYS